MKSILCVEDNAEIQILVQAALDQYHVTAVSQVSEARSLIYSRKFDLVILDVELPDGDGLKFLAEIVGISDSDKTPIFILTGKSDTSNKVIAFSLGADDFISKPFDALELRARVNAKIKKLDQSDQDKSVIKLKDMTIDVTKQRIYLAQGKLQESITLTSL